MKNIDELMTAMPGVSVVVKAQDLRDFIRDVAEEVATRVINAALRLDTNAVMNRHEAAAYLSLTTYELAARTRKNDVPHMNVGNKVLYSRSDLDKWLESNRVPTNEEISELAVTHCVLNPLKEPKRGRRKKIS